MTSTIEKETNEFKQLCQSLVDEFGEEKSFYDLEPILEQRESYVTEDLLLYIFVHRKTDFNEMIKRVMEFSSDISTEDACELIKSVCYGTITIYPSELKRAGIPLSYYKYATWTDSKKDYSLASIVRFWSSMFPLYKKEEYPVNLLYTEITGLFLSQFSIFMVYKHETFKADTLLKMKLPEYFYYLDCTIDSRYHTFSQTVEALKIYIPSDICIIIEKQALRNDLFTSIYKTIYEAFTKMTKEVLGLPNPNIRDEYIRDSVINFNQYLIQKYFEYRMVKHNEKMLFGFFDFKDVYLN